MIDLDDIRAARDVIAPHLHRTPLVHTETLSAMTGANLLLKAENLQKTGSYKPRGAINAVQHLSAEARTRGIIAVSAGNHGQAVAFAGRMASVPAAVVMPDTAPAAKIAAIVGYGGEPILVAPDQLLEELERIAEERGLFFVDPFDSPYVLAGAGTVGLEIVEDMPDVELVVVGVGGGGLIGGVAAAVKALNPDVTVIGVEPVGSNIVTQSLSAGRSLHVKGLSTIADGLNPPFTKEGALTLVRNYVDEIVLVSDVQIAHAMGLIMERTKMVVEPAGAAAVAALLNGKVPQAVGKRTVAVLSGGNFDLTRLASILAVGFGAVE